MLHSHSILTSILLDQPLRPGSAPVDRAAHAVTSYSMCAEVHECDLVAAGYGEAWRLTDLCSKAPAGWVTNRSPQYTTFFDRHGEAIGGRERVSASAVSLGLHCEHLLRAP